MREFAAYQKNSNSKNDPQTPKINPNILKNDSRGTKINSRVSKKDSLIQEIDSQASKINSHISKNNAPTSKKDSLTLKINSQTSKNDSQALKINSHLVQASRLSADKGRLVPLLSPISIFSKNFLVNVVQSCPKTFFRISFVRAMGSSRIFFSSLATIVNNPVMAISVAY